MSTLFIKQDLPKVNFRNTKPADLKPDVLNGGIQTVHSCAPHNKKF